MAPKAIKRKSNASDKYGPSEKRDFHVYDKVFAKMRGYPPWPAKITNIKVDSKTKSLKSKCEVYFYGSNQIGQCVFSDIHDYEANKDRFKDVCAQMKSLKTSFLLGLKEIEDDNGPLLEEIEDGSVAKISFDDSFVSVEEDTASPVVKKSKKTIEKDTTLNISDKEDDQEEKTDKEEEVEVEENDNTQTDTSSDTQEDNEKEIEKTAAVEPDDCSFDVTSVQPQEPKKKSFEKSEATPKNNKKATEEINQQSAISNNSNKAPSLPSNEEEVTNPSLLQTECTLLALEKDIKESVGINRVDFTKALSAINSLLDLELTPLMLKKNPEIVDTFLKLQRYVGERVKSQLPPSTQPTFDEHATVVRNLATRTLDKFSTLFVISSGRTFMETFRTEMVKFIKRTRDMTPSEVLKLTNDPC